MVMLKKRFKTASRSPRFWPYFENIAIGIEINAPQIAALLVVFFQNNPNMNTAKIPGYLRLVYS
jgi:hypothetical protein